MVDLRKIALALPGVEPGFAAGAGDRVTLPPEALPAVITPEHWIAASHGRVHGRLTSRASARTAPAARKSR